MKCLHQITICLNQFELIRKYECSSCKSIMMCACDKEHGERFYSHQLSEGRWLETQKKVPVTLGFQKNICPECKGEKPESAPHAPQHGKTSKITRYYWREIMFTTTRRFAELHPGVNEFSLPEERKRIEKEVIAEIKELHATAPKYEYQEVSQIEVIQSTNTEVISVQGHYVKTENWKSHIDYKGLLLTVEEFATEYFQDKGYSVIQTESVPFHVIFGIYMQTFPPAIFL